MNEDGGQISTNDKDIMIQNVMPKCSKIIRWRKGQVVEAWDAHKAAVQAVIKLPSGELVTGLS